MKCHRGPLSDLDSLKAAAELQIWEARAMGDPEEMLEEAVKTVSATRPARGTSEMTMTVVSSPVGGERRAGEVSRET